MRRRMPKTQTSDDHCTRQRKFKKNKKNTFSECNGHCTRQRKFIKKTPFAECRLHSAKAALHSTKPLPSATLGKEPPSNPLPVKAALPSVKFRAFGKGFAECRAGTRQRFDAVGRRRLIFFKLFAECHSSGTRQRNLFLNLFAECHGTGTRQRVFFYFF